MSSNLASALVVFPSCLSAILGPQNISKAQKRIRSPPICRKGLPNQRVTVCSQDHESHGPNVLSHRSDPSRRLLMAGLSIPIVQHPYKSVAAIISASAPQDGVRIVSTTSTGLQFSDIREGRGETPRVGEVVAVHIRAWAEDDRSERPFLDSLAAGVPLIWTLGIQNEFVSEGLEEAVLSMRRGGLRLAAVPPSIGYGNYNGPSPLSRRWKNSWLKYEIELLRCVQLPEGLACCSDSNFPCRSPA